MDLKVPSLWESSHHFGKSDQNISNGGNGRAEKGMNDQRRKLSRHGGKNSNKFMHSNKHSKEHRGAIRT